MFPTMKNDPIKKKNKNSSDVIFHVNKDKEADCLIIDITKERYLDQYVYSVCFYSSSICIYLV